MTDKKATEIKNGIETTEASLMNARRRFALRTVEVTTGDLADTTWYLGDFAPDSYMLPLNKLYHPTIAGMSVDIGTKDTPDAFKDGLDIATGKSKELVTTDNVIAGIKQLWEMVGLTKCPADYINLYLTIKADATVDFKLSLSLDYTT